MQRMATKELTSAEVVYALVDAEAVGKLTVTGGGALVVITGSAGDRDRARKVLKARGFTCTRNEDRDEVTRHGPGLTWGDTVICPDCGHDHETLECPDCPEGYCEVSRS